MDAATQRVIDRQDIHDVLMRYARGIDRLDMDLVRSCYHSGAHDDHGPFKGRVEDFVSWVGKALRRFDATMHVLANEFIELDGDQAHVETYCVAYHVQRGEAADWVVGLRYVDRFERRADIWAIADRAVVFEWSRHYDAASPGLPDDALMGSRDRSDPVYRR